jgi:hypothetical protein
MHLINEGTYRLLSSSRDTTITLARIEIQYPCLACASSSFCHILVFMIIEAVGAHENYIHFTDTI